MGFFDELGKVIGDVNGIVDETKQAIQDGAGQVQDLKDEATSVGDELKTNLADKVDTIKDVFKPKL